MPLPDLRAADILPADGCAGLLLGRIEKPDPDGGPIVVAITEAGARDLSTLAPTVAGLLNLPDPVRAIVATVPKAPIVAGLDELVAASLPEARGKGKPHLLAPIDLQAVKACGVTFARSMLERVIEEKAAGDPARAASIRAAIVSAIGADLSAVKPGSAEAEKLKQALIAGGMWSQYLEVGIGPYAEVFTKSQPMSSVGFGAEIGIHPESRWNNPEPETVLVVNRRGAIMGATLGNDVNLRDFEGRSALLLGRAKDNNGSSAIGPFIRLFDGTFSLETARGLEISLEVAGEDGFVLSDKSSMRQISRDIADLVAQTINENHSYPDGFALFTGTMFAPTKDRDGTGQGFTHKLGDIVTIAAPELGRLVNRVNRTDKVAPWSFGAGDLMRNLAARGLL